MATYTKETALYDTGKIGTDITNAGQTANGYLTDVASDGVFVHEYSANGQQPTDTGANGVHISDDVDIVRSGKVVASYGTTAKIGAEGNASISISPSSITGLGEEGKEFFNFSNTDIEMTVSKVLNVADGIPASQFPYTSASALSATLTGASSTVNPTLYFYIGSEPPQRVATINFTYGTSETKIVTTSRLRVDFPFTATYDGSTSITDIRAREHIYDDTQISVKVIYGATSTAPCYEIGGNVSATGAYSFAEGVGTQATNTATHAEGSDTTASGLYSHAEGDGTTASKQASHAEGRDTTASDNYSHAEGYNTTASGQSSHAEGVGTTASSGTAHAEGSATTASGFASHTEGGQTVASAYYSHAQNYYTKANMKAQTAIGTFNQEDSAPSTAVHPTGDTGYGNYAFIIGNGTGNLPSQRSNALTVDWNGNVQAAGDTIVKGHSTPIGTVSSASKSVAITSTSIDTYVEGASITLTAGTYVIKGQFSFNSASGTGVRVINADITTVAGTTADSAPLGRVRVVNGARNWSRLEPSAIATFTTSTTVYIKGSSTVTSTGNSTEITAIRIV